MAPQLNNGRDTRSGRFLRGNRAGPGRPVGSRNRLATKFLDDLHKQWRKSGAEVLARVARDDPVQLMKVVAAILPREIDSTLNMNVSLLAEIHDFNEAYTYALKHIGAETKLIEHRNGHDDSNADD
jgi:hypothetical protein